MDKFGSFIMAVLISIAGALYGGWVLSKIWLWIIVPQFELPPLTLWGAIGIKIIVGYLRGYNMDEKEVEKSKHYLLKNLGKGLSYKFVYGMMAIGSAWIVTHFM